MQDRAPVGKITLALVALVAVILYFIPGPSRTVLRQMAGSILKGLLDIIEYVRRFVHGFL